MVMMGAKGIELPGQDWIWPSSGIHGYLPPMIGGDPSGIGNSGGGGLPFGGGAGNQVPYAPGIGPGQGVVPYAPGMQPGIGSGIPAGAFGEGVGVTAGALPAATGATNWFGIPPELLWEFLGGTGSPPPGFTGPPDPFGPPPPGFTGPPEPPGLGDGFKVPDWLKNLLKGLLLAGALAPPGDGDGGGPTVTGGGFKGGGASSGTPGLGTTNYRPMRGGGNFVPWNPGRGQQMLGGGGGGGGQSYGSMMATLFGAGRR